MKNEDTTTSRRLSQQDSLPDIDAEEIIESLRLNIQSKVKPEYVGRAPTKTDIEDELGLTENCD